MIMTEELKDEIIRYLIDYIKIKERENKESHLKLVELLRDAKKELVERGVFENSGVITNINSIIYER